MDFDEATEKLRTDPRRSPGELEIIAGNLRDLARPVIRIGVLSECGHSWNETRPEGTVAPVNGELRVCGDPGCYPGQFPVTYSEPVSAET